MLFSSRIQLEVIFQRMRPRVADNIHFFSGLTCERELGLWCVTMVLCIASDSWSAQQHSLLSSFSCWILNVGVTLFYSEQRKPLGVHFIRKTKWWFFFKRMLCTTYTGWLLVQRLCLEHDCISWMWSEHHCTRPHDARVGMKIPSLTIPHCHFVHTFLLWSC